MPYGKGVTLWLNSCAMPTGKKAKYSRNTKQHKAGRDETLSTDLHSSSTQDQASSTRVGHLVRTPGSGSHSPTASAR